MGRCELPERAVTFFDQMIKYGHKPNVDTFQILVQAVPAGTEQFQYILPLIEQLHRLQYTVQALKVLMTAYFKNDMPAEALELLVAYHARMHKKPRPRETNMILSRFLHSSRPELATEYLEWLALIFQ